MSAPNPHAHGIKFEVFTKRLVLSFEGIIGALNKLLPEPATTDPAQIETLRTELLNKIEQFEQLCDEIYTILEYNKQLVKIKTVTGTTPEGLSHPDTINKLATQNKEAKQLRQMMKDFKKDVQMLDTLVQ